jgi:hypothetical protein
MMALSFACCANREERNSICPESTTCRRRVLNTVTLGWGSSGSSGRKRR